MSRLTRTVLLLVVVLALALGGTLATLPVDQVELTGLAGPVLGAAALKTTSVSVRTGGHDTRLLVDGRQLAHGNRPILTLSLAGLSDGKHRILAEVHRAFGRTASATRTVVVDTLPPAMQVTLPTGRVPLNKAVILAGTREKGATVTAEGGTVTLDGPRFTVRFAVPPSAASIVATDAAGNSSTREVTVPTIYPSNIRAVHLTGRAWDYDPLREPVLAMARQHRINAVQLDIKDEDGVVNYPTMVPLAGTIGARAAFYDAKKVTDQLHQMGVRVIGRIVAFNDPKLSTWAMAHGHQDWVVQNPDGSKYLYGYNKSGFTNFAAKPVRDYNIALAAEAVRAGFDDVIFDYVRRPDGPVDLMRFPGLKGEPEDAIAGFLGEARAVIRPLGGSLGAAAFAQASTRPQPTAQNIGKMAKNLDVVIPMDYPSHWNPGEYGVPDPYIGAYDIVQRSLVDWQKAVAGTDCVVVPWLQDENYKGIYDAAKVQQQIKGARADGIPGWLMWSASARYTPAAYSPDATSAL